MTNEANRYASQLRGAPAAAAARETWYANKPFQSHLLNAYTFLIPDGERFIIRTCNRYLDRADPSLAEEVKCLFLQEGSHSREHARLVRAMAEQGMTEPWFLKFANFLSYKVLEPLSTSPLRLATAAAIEHHNAIISIHFLSDSLLRDVRDTELRRLFLWHFAEEIEHKETVYKLLHVVTRSWLVRMLGLLVSSCTFLAFLGIGAAMLGMRSGSALTVGYWTDLIKSTFGKNSLARKLFRGSLCYLKPGFRPSVDESSKLMNDAFAELSRLAVEPSSQAKSGEAGRGGAIPPKFLIRMNRTMQRLESMRSRYEFFFDRIDQYDGAWVVNQGKRKLNFCTYSYLGLLRHPKVDRAAIRAVKRYGTGTHGVRLLGGNLDIHEQLEAHLAKFFRRESAISFSSGFMTNLSVIGTLAGKADVVLYDELCHASIVDGGRYSHAQIVKFPHNDMGALETHLRMLPASSRKLVVVDGVYSMDGDIAPLDLLIALKSRYPNTMLMVDEAHSLGVLGDTGRGIEEHFDCIGEIDVLMGTMSKTLPGQGGYIAGSDDLVSFLRFNARGFIFSAPVSPATSAAVKAGLSVIEREGRMRRARLMTNVSYFIHRLRDEGFEVGNTQSAIIPILMRDEKLAFEVARLCNLRGVYAMPAVYPAVPKGTERLRMNVTYDHTRSDLDFAIAALLHARAAVQA
ncbi:aminotransferase class I/II-fold pyridoxal phosphate-dependent enzyme [Cupriavidus pampae]|uniref:8-amino-7-oxononanoate synthase n=1 Tax=Cupriavidus pampae TaxID=659251 RepID=A0ABM8XZT4_9BURK|nr:aminotransferase class I/II-fold pyridoxal phosphate-dependent enzyme [Cupriavidus pampae]CAG9185975.1 8-amino-7-oxononanoate synthase [Cupriavidus pampae]